MKWFQPRQKNDTLVTARQIADRLPEILLQARKIAGAIQRGRHGLRQAGQGSHFWQYRSYDPYADSAARIDWRQSARSENLYVRESEEEHAQTLMIWLDPSASMMYSGAPQTRLSKYEYGFLLACVLAYLTSEGQERVVTPDSQHSILHPSQVPLFADSLLKTNSVPDFNPPPRTHVVIISDFLLQDSDALNDLQQVLKTRGIYYRVLHMIDPVEKEFDFKGHIDFHGMEGSEQHFETRDAAGLKAEYLKNFLNLEKHIHALFGRKSVLPVNTGCNIQASAYNIWEDLIS